MNQVKQGSDRLLSLQECADILGLSIWTMRAWAQNGKITTHKVGSRRLVAKSTVDKLIEDSRIPALPGIRIGAKR